MTTNVDFWFDPGCPFTWRTSRWLSEVAHRHALAVNWRLLSLYTLNQDKDVSPDFRERLTRIHRAGLLLEAVRMEYGNDTLEAAYASVGTRLHDSHQEPDDGTFGAALADVGLPHRLIEESSGEAVRESLLASHHAAQQAVGMESDSPIIAFDSGPAFFGPVVVPVPTGAEAERLLEAVVLLSEVPAFSELKRPRRPF